MKTCQLKTELETNTKNLTLSNTPQTQQTMSARHEPTFDTSIQRFTNPPLLLSQMLGNTVPVSPLSKYCHHCCADNGFAPSLTMSTSSAPFLV